MTSTIPATLPQSTDHLGIVTPFDVVDATWRRVFIKMSSDIPRIVLAAWLGNSLEYFTDPCWLSLIAPSSTGKTVLLSALGDADGGNILDSLTAQTWLSGLILGKGTKKRKFGLLRQLGARPKVVVKDLSAILSKNPTERGEILGQLRSIYDGEYARPTGRSEDDEDSRWKGRMTLVVGVTPVVDIYHALHNQLGERFIQLRYEIAQDDVVAVARKSQSNSRNGVTPKKDLTQAIRQALQLARPWLSTTALDGFEDRLANLVALVSLARTGVMRGASGEAQIEPAAEGPGRLMSQLSALGCGLAALRGTPTLQEQDFQRLVRTAFDSVPEPRAQLFWMLYKDGARTVGDFKQRVRLSDNTIRRHLDDLILLALADEIPNTDGLPKTYMPTPLGLKYLGRATPP